MAAKCTDLIARFWAKVNNTAGPDGCWTWSGAHSQKSRFRPARPIFWVTRTHLPGEGWRGAHQVIVPAARMALSLTDGVCLDEREGLEARHRCHNAACVNPAHLVWGTPEENRDDRYATTVDEIRERLGTL